MHKTIFYSKITWTIFITVLYLSGFAQNQPWNIPPEKSARKSHIRFTPATAKQGQDFFMKNCTSCHGIPGKNNNLKSLKPIPPDLASPGTQKHTDGDLFYIITVGRGVMPSFASVLSEEQRWLVVSYIRSFDKAYKQQVSRFDPNKAKLVHVEMEYDSLARKLVAVIYVGKDNRNVPLGNSEVGLSVKRYFGNYQVGSVSKTNERGEAVFDFPTNLPGDKDGNVQVVVTVNDGTYGEIQSVRKLRLGIPTDRPALTSQRSMWNVVTKAPVWLLLVYTFCVLVVLGSFGYIFFNLYKIRKITN
ncbi:MAG TPA: cytochrome c [Paludibacter sp.]|nr:cytochrome c [Paludibacter sp.]